MRIFLLLALLAFPVAFLAGCGESVAYAPDPEVKAAQVTPVKPAVRPVAAVTPAPKPVSRLDSRPAMRDGMIVIPAVKLPKGWSYMDEQDLAAAQ